MKDKRIIIKRIRDCDNCKFKPETSKVCSGYENCYMVSEYIVNLREQLKAKEQECEALQMSDNEAGEIIAELKAKCDRLKHDNEYEVGALEKTIDNLNAELEQEKVLKEMYFTYYKAKHSDIKGEFFKLKAENEELKEQLEKEIEASQKWYQLHTDEHFTKLKLEQTLAEIKEVLQLYSNGRIGTDKGNGIL